MNKEISRSPNKHEFLLNLAKSPPLSFDHFDYLPAQPHSKDSGIEEDEQLSFHKDLLTTAADHPSIKNPTISSYSIHNKKSHAKKKSFDYSKDTVTHQLGTPSSTSNAKLLNKSSQSRTVNKSSPSQQLNFLNSKEFAKFALSKVLPKDNKKEKSSDAELSPQPKGSKPESVEKVSPKTFLKDSIQAKLSAQPSGKKQNLKLRSSNMTYNEFSSLLDQSRQIHSFINSPQKLTNMQPTLTSTKSTSNLRPSSTKNTSHNSKNSWLQGSNEPTKGLEASGRKNHPPKSASNQESKRKERHKGIQSIVSILNLRRDKNTSPGSKNTNSCYPASQYHRKVASIGSGTKNTGHSLSNSASHSNLAHAISPLVIPQEDNSKANHQRNLAYAKKTMSSPIKRGFSPPKYQEEEEDEEMLDEKKMQSEYFTGLQSTFDNVLEKYKSDIESAHESYNLMSKIKHAYESFITDLLNNQPNTKEITQALLREDNSLKTKFDTMNQQKLLLEEVQRLKAENQKLRHIVINDKRDRVDFSNSEDSRGEASNKGSSKRSDENIEGIQRNKFIDYKGKGHNETDNMKQMLAVQQNTIYAMRNQEDKMWRLLHAVRKRGLDLEKIYREEVQGPVSTLNLDHLFAASSRLNIDLRKDENERESIAEVPSHMEILSLCSAGGGSDFSGMTDIMPDIRELVSAKNISDARTTDTTPYLVGVGNQLGTSTLGKNKLKLDFGGLPNQKNNLKLQFGNNIVSQQQDYAEPVGFHDEFMSKLAEFSLSWRQEAMNHRNI